MTTENTIHFYTATYSAEDNKLRLYGPRMDDVTYAKARELGFKYAPKQELFVTPMWTPAREDFCMELAGDIEAEQTTLLERTEAKAERLDDLATKRARDADLYYQAASHISERFAGGQPILVGHHSERGARKDQQRMRSAMDKSVKAQTAVGYWSYRATGVEHHANRKSNPGVRTRRIKTLLAELRDRQRDINHANFCLRFWKKLETEQESSDFEDRVLYYVGTRLKTGSMAPNYATYSDSLDQRIREKKITAKDAIEICIKFHEREAQSHHTFRWINHILNRLSFERSELGEVARFEGELTSVIIQAFARENGTDKPMATKTDNGFKLTSPVELPFHLGDGSELELSIDKWLDLMQSSGYEVPAEKPEHPPILNFKAEALRTNFHRNVTTMTQVEMTKEEYSKVPSDYRGVRLSLCGKFRFRVCFCRYVGIAGYHYIAVFLTNSKVHSIPAAAETSDISEECASNA